MDSTPVSTEPGRRSTEAALAAFRDPELGKSLLATLERELQGSSLRFMEVCGTHTVSIFQSGLHALMPASVTHLTGPGCPVCVTHDREVAAYLELAKRGEVIIATFGDLLRVPGPGGLSLKTAKAQGARVAIVYSPLDALKLAADNPTETVVFLGIGFETTAPTVAGAMKMAKAQGLDNFLVMAFHKVVPPALEALLTDGQAAIEGFVLPGHVSAVIGLEPYRFIADRHHLPAAIAGFEAVDILQALIHLARAKREGAPSVVNLYRRVVADQGNPRAMAILDEVFEPSDGLWRGIGLIPGSGLAVREEFARLDAWRRLALSLPEVEPLKGCRCGEVLKGLMPPNACPLFGTACTPARPVGPCMVSTEGSCAAYYKYNLKP